MKITKIANNILSSISVEKIQKIISANPFVCSTSHQDTTAKDCDSERQNRIIQENKYFISQKTIIYA